MKRYVQRDDSGKVNGHFANPHAYALEELPEDHPDILAWNEGRKAAQISPLKALEARVVKLESLLGK